MKLEKENQILPPSTGGSVVNNLPTNTRDMGLIPESRRYPGEGNGNPLQYPCLENLRDRGSLVLVHGITRVRHNFMTKNNNFTLLILV